MADYSLYIPLYILGGMILILAVALLRLEYRLKKLLAGKSGTSLEDVIADIQKEITAHESKHKETAVVLADLDGRAKKSIKSIKTIRFNPFKDSGGNQSFAMLLADEEGDGVIISSLYSRERMSIYAKPLNKFESEHELSEEEQSIIDERKKEK